MNDMIFWTPNMSLAELEKRVIIRCLDKNRGNKTMTANELGIAVRTIDNKLKEYAEHDRKFAEERELDRIKQLEYLDRARGIKAGDYGSFSSPKKGAEILHGPVEGLRVESALEAPKEQQMPMQERKEVQGVLSSNSSKGDHIKISR